MTTKLTTLTIQKALEGAAVDDSMPPGWLTSFVDRAKKSIPAEEWASARLRGGADLRIEYQHAVTPMEALQDELEVYRAKEQALRSLFHPDGTLTAGFAERLKAILR